MVFLTLGTSKSLCWKESKGIRMNILETKVYGIEPAIQGMRNPLKSWEKSDSIGDVIGEKDLNLAKKLIRGGSEHRKFLRQIFVTMYIEAPMYWFAEFDTYKIGTTRNSTSFMHTGLKEPFKLEHFAHSEDTLLWNMALDNLNELRDKYLEDKDPEIFNQLRSLLPSGYIYGSSISMNYENVINILGQRRFHKLPEWQIFCDKLEELPYIKEFLSI